jgi:hypothetical protein
MASMAQTKQKPGSRRSASSNSTRSRSSTGKSNGSGRASQAKSKKAKSTTKAASKSGAKSKSKSKAKQSSNGVADSVKQTVAETSNGLAPVARKAVVPLVATGAAVAGVAGAVVAARSNRKRSVLGVKIPKAKPIQADAQKISSALVDAARRADKFGQQVSKVASSVQNVGEAANDAAKKSR